MDIGRTDQDIADATPSRLHAPIPQHRSTAPIARLVDAGKRYGLGDGAVTALEGVNLELGRGAFTAIMGPSGSGKSTLMHLMAGLDEPSSGQVWLDEVRLDGLGDAQLTLLRRRRIGFVFQAFNLVPTIDVLDNITLPFQLDGRSPNPQEQLRIDGLLERLGLLDRLRHRPHQLSGGQQQRVAIARALATAPSLVFADEPTGNLDSRSGREVLTLLRSASRQHGQSIAMVTHDPIAASYADRIVFLADGRIVQDAGPMQPEQIARTILSMEPAA